VAQGICQLTSSIQNNDYKLTREITFSSKIKRLQIFAISTCLFFSGCAHLNSSVSDHNSSSSSFRVFKNQNVNNLEQQYKKAYIVTNYADTLNVSQQMADALNQQGILTEQFESNTFFAPQGTGFFITSSGYLLTCDHVIGHREKLDVQYNGEKVPFNVVLRDPFMDLALLKTEKIGPWPSIPFSTNTSYELGEDVFALGYPLSALLGTSPRLTQGIVSASVGFADEPTQFQISAPIQPGNSGGPILNQYGELLGIAQSTLDVQQASDYTGGAIPQNVNFAVNRDSIAEFLLFASQLDLISPLEVKRILEPQKQTHSVATHRKFNQAAQASLLISGPPQNQEDALVIAIDYTAHPESDQSLVNLFTVTLFDFRSKKPLYRLTQRHDNSDQQQLLNASIMELNHFLASSTYPERMEHVMIVPAPTQVVASRQP
tara:strand:+ start:14484 stop:15779 length:1296 start_codon:yes stop_codon:yes gene_type:complete